jgi:triacylglycerol lipase
MPVPSFRKRHIMFLHGWGAHKLMMSFLVHRLATHGYSTTNWGYWSMGKSMEHHAQKICQTWEAFDKQAEIEELFLVTHSMGGIVARTALTMYRPRKLKRLVMLAPPNKGSRWATILGPWLLPIGKTLTQLADVPDSFVNQLPEPQDLEIGIVSAGMDFLVPIVNTRLQRPHDHIHVPNAIHSGVLFRAKVAEEIHHFFEHGYFSASAANYTKTT